MLNYTWVRIYTVHSMFCSNQAMLIWAKLLSIHTSRQPGKWVLLWMTAQQKPPGNTEATTSSSLRHFVSQGSTSAIFLRYILNLCEPLARILPARVSLIHVLKVVSSKTFKQHDPVIKATIKKSQQVHAMAAQHPSQSTLMFQLWHWETHTHSQISNSQSTANVTCSSKTTVKY